ncbi:MAG: hypothetical protein U0K79_08850 [Phascolarctobacterium sp.]|nr:hypothetical protein [Phascolarctobacterium sp.]
MTRYKAITDEQHKSAIIQRLMIEEIHRLDQNALKSILKSTEGRWFLMRLLDATGVNSNSFTGNSTTFFNEGKRQVGLELLARIQEIGLDAVKLKQKAELEYISHQQKARELAVEYTENEEGSI